MDSARNVAESSAQDLAPVVCTITPSPTAAPTSPTTSDLRGAAQLQANVAGAQASATPPDAELLAIASAVLLSTADEGAAMEAPVLSAVVADTQAASSCAATPVLDAVATQLDADLPRANIPASSQSAAEDDAGDNAGDDTTSAAERYWIPCHITEGHLDAMAAEGLIPPKKDGGWRSAFGDLVPKPRPDERVMLTSHIHRGLGFPPSLFFLEVCSYYGLQPHNLTPNSILYIAGYQALFEGWLGLSPRLDFFRYVFQPRRQTIGDKGRKELAVCGTVSINMRRNRDWYPKVPKIDSVKDWTGTFFYCKEINSKIPFVDQ